MDRVNSMQLQQRHDGAGGGAGSAPQVAVVTTFYPNSGNPTRTVFVENLVHALRTECRVHVIAPMPYAPPLRRWRALRGVARVESRKGVAVEHPRFMAMPRLELFNGLTYAVAVAAALLRCARRHPGLIVHVHCAYPDGVGVAIVARLLRIPYVVTCHGSDLNVYSRRSSLVAQIRWALRHAAQVIAVSSGLQRRAIDLVGPDLAGRCHRIPCAAADPAVFNIEADKAALREAVGLPAASRVVVFIGQLVPVKGVDILITAWTRLARDGRLGPGDLLLLVGAGSEESRLRLLAQPASPRIRFLGALPQQRVAEWLRAADLLCLPSLNEGTPNVVIEALACGRPVVASRVGSIPEFVHEGRTGALAQPGDSEDLAEALLRGLSGEWDEGAIAATVARYTWRNIAHANAEVLRGVRDAAR